jgi:hypothetical protein
MTLAVVHVYVRIYLHVHVIPRETSRLIGKITYVFSFVTSEYGIQCKVFIGTSLITVDGNFYDRLRMLQLPKLNISSYVNCRVFIIYGLPQNFKLRRLYFLLLLSY